jgi:tRNA threonylcarbamoyladenosine biosynthesis protein TsaE
MAPRDPVQVVGTTTDAETAALGAALAGTLSGGDIVLLVGDLGAGKTAFVRGLAAGLGADPDEVSSPTFTLVQEYRGRVPIEHVDLYRMSGRADVEDLGLDEFARAGAVVAVEWAERYDGPWPAHAIWVEIADEGDDRRRITIRRPRVGGSAS